MPCLQALIVDPNPQLFHYETAGFAYWALLLVFNCALICISVYVCLRTTQKACYLFSELGAQNCTTFRMGKKCGRVYRMTLFSLTRWSSRQLLKLRQSKFKHIHVGHGLITIYCLNLWRYWKQQYYWAGSRWFRFLCTPNRQFKVEYNMCCGGSALVVTRWAQLYICSMLCLWHMGMKNKLEGQTRHRDQGVEGRGMREYPLPHVSHIYNIWLLYAPAANWKKYEQHLKASDQSLGCIASSPSQLEWHVLNHILHLCWAWLGWVTVCGQVNHLSIWSADQVNSAWPSLDNINSLLVE